MFFISSKKLFSFSRYSSFCIFVFPSSSPCQFLSYFKITVANLCKAIHEIIKYSTSIHPFEFGKCGTKGKHYKNLNISRSKRAFEMKQKAILIVFEGVSFGQKIFDKKQRTQALSSIINLSSSDQLKKTYANNLPWHQV